MEIIIGRDINTGRLKVCGDGKSILYGIERIPESVVPAHIKLTIEGNIIRLKNLDINSYTYVNGQAIESKSIEKYAQIELGTHHYPFDWRSLDEFIPPTADIRPLKAIWDEYENKNIALQITERKFNTLRSMTGLITMTAIVLSVVSGGKSSWYVLLYGIAIVSSLVFFVKSYRDSSKIPQQKQEQNKIFQHDYICPHCGRFLGNQSYEVLTQTDHCPYCKAKFIH